MDENRLSAYDKNTQAIIDIRAKLDMEMKAIEKTNNEGAVEMMNDVIAIVDNMLGVGTIRSRGAGTDMGDLVLVLRNYVKYIETILAGGILTPLTGREEEWADVDIANGSEKYIVRNFRGIEYRIDFKSVQVNKRYGNIYRFNKDNKYAHRMDMILFTNVNAPNNTIVNNASLRFIQFPYTLEQVRIASILDEQNQFARTADGDDLQEVMDTIAFKATSGNVVAAPPIPFTTLKKDFPLWHSEISALIGSD